MALCIFDVMAPSAIVAPVIRLFLQQLVQVNSEENFKATHHWPFGGRSANDRYSPSNKGAVIRKTFPSHDVTIGRDAGFKRNLEGLAQDCSNSSALAMELLQSRAKLSIFGLEIVRRLSNYRLVREWALSSLCNCNVTQRAFREFCKLFGLWFVLLWFAWWRHQMETFSALLAISPVTGEFPIYRPVTQSFDVSLICAWINAWVNNRETVDLRRRRAHYDVIVMDLSEVDFTDTIQANSEACQ